MCMGIQNTCYVQLLNTKETMDEQQILREEQWGVGSNRENFELEWRKYLQDVENKTGNVEQELEWRKCLSKESRGWKDVGNKTEDFKQEPEQKNRNKKESRA